MGLAKEQMMDAMQDNCNRRIANYLGITGIEFDEYHTETGQEESNEGLIYNYIIYFSEDMPQAIWDKIQGDKGDNCVIIPAHIFENL